MRASEIAYEHHPTDQWLRKVKEQGEVIPFKKFWLNGCGCYV